MVFEAPAQPIAPEHQRERERESVCVCVCVFERERERERKEKERRESEERRERRGRERERETHATRTHTHTSTGKTFGNIVARSTAGNVRSVQRKGIHARQHKHHYGKEKMAQSSPDRGQGWMITRSIISWIPSPPDDCNSLKIPRSLGTR